MKILNVIWLSCLMVSFFTTNLLAELVKHAGDFRLLDQNGYSRSLHYYSDYKGVVLYWQENGCQYVRDSLPYITNLKKEYESRGIKFLMLNANVRQNRFDIRMEAENFNINMPVLEDVTQVITEEFGVKMAGEVLLISTLNWNVIYQGAVSDSFEFKAKEAGPARHYLKDAMDQLLNEESVSITQTQLNGCAIEFEESQKYTYTDDIAPILINRCVSCHSDGGAAPWSMTDYTKIRGWAPMIQQVLKTNRMPPFSPDPYYGKFRNQHIMTPNEAAKVIRWIDNGMLRGEGADPIKEMDKIAHTQWPLGEPDLIISYEKPSVIPATGVLPYTYTPGDKVIDEELWIRASAVKPGNKRTTHHVMAIVIPKDLELPYESDGKIHEFLVDDLNQYIGIYVPGLLTQAFDDNLARYVPKDSKILFEAHYVTTGRQETDVTQLGLYLYDGDPDREMKIDFIQNSRFKIPANTKEFPVLARKKFNKDIILYKCVPHMHYRGRSIRYIAEYPDGSTEVILSVPDYNFQWQHQYVLEKPKFLPAGTVLKIEGVFDNSLQNPNNPDANADVYYGKQSADEMFIGSIVYTDQIQ